MKTTIPDLLEKKKRREKITLLTAYDVPIARLLDEAGIDAVLVGDSLGMVALGYPTTVPVTMREMIHHAKAVRRAVSRALVIGDMPFMSFNLSRAETVRNAGRFLKEAGCDLYGKEAVIVGHSELIGKPVSLLLLDRFCTTTVCHVATSERGALSEHVRRAEILVVAVGKPHLVKGAWIRPGAVVIDVGTSLVDGQVTGDVEFAEAVKVASFITPVPGWVGPVVVATLMRNTVEAFKLQVQNR